jgi:hypothetical protein
MFVFTVSRTEENCENIKIKTVGVGARVNPGHPTYGIAGLTVWLEPRQLCPDDTWL